MVNFVGFGKSKFVSQMSTVVTQTVRNLLSGGSELVGCLDGCASTTVGSGLRDE